MNQKIFSPVSDTDLKILNDTITNAKILGVITDQNNYPYVMIETKSGDALACYSDDLYKILQEIKQRRQPIKAANSILSITAGYFGKDISAYDEYSDLADDVIEILVDADSETCFNSNIRNKNPIFKNPIDEIEMVV